jgi:RNA polymerase sigma factor (sigma-70 family)
MYINRTIKGNKWQLTALNSQIKNKRQYMAEAMFSEKEELFKQRTGKDFTQVYQKYYPKLIYFTNKICNDIQKAEDISTESFMVALDKIEKYEKEKSQISTWLFTIAKNLSLQELKTEKRSISMDVEYDSEGTTMKDFIDTEDDTEEELIRQEIFDRKASVMKKHISELKEPYKTVIEMREIQKMPYQEIADKLGRNLSTIKSQIRNGRHLLISRSEQEFLEIDQLSE